MREGARDSRSSNGRRAEIIARIIRRPVELQLVDVVADAHLCPIGNGVGQVDRVWIRVQQPHIKPLAGCVVTAHDDIIAVDRRGYGWREGRRRGERRRDVDHELHFVDGALHPLVICRDCLHAVQTRIHQNSTGPLGRVRWVLAAGRISAETTIGLGAVHECVYSIPDKPIPIIDGEIDLHDALTIDANAGTGCRIGVIRIVCHCLGG